MTATLALNHLHIRGRNLQILDVAGSKATYWLQLEQNADCYGLETMDIGPDETVIDIGANIGLFAILVAKKFGCRVMAFEPLKLLHDIAAANIIINGANDDGVIELHNTAIGSHDGEIEIKLDPLNTGGSSAFRGGIGFTCEMESIDRYIEGAEKLALLKIDCEGGEYDIVPALLPHLNRFRYIAIEYHKYAEWHDPFALDRLIRENYRGQLIADHPGRAIPAEQT